MAVYFTQFLTRAISGMQNISQGNVANVSGLVGSLIATLLQFRKAVDKVR